jgi:hypothetical protein
MADKNWRERLTNADGKNWQYAYRQWQERDAEEWAMSPRNSSVAQKMYPPGLRQPFRSNAERGSVSPLGGVAQPATATTKGKR